MSKAKIIDRIEYTKLRTKHLRKEEPVMDEPEVIVCPECRQKLIHEAGCLRCFCGWSRC